MWEFDLPYTRPPLTLNGRYHWAVSSRITKELRMLGKVLTRKVPTVERCKVELVWYVKDRRRRDTINPSPTLKALVDGIVDGEVVADDDYTKVATDVVIVYRPGQDAGMALRIIEK